MMIFCPLLYATDVENDDELLFFIPGDDEILKVFVKSDDEIFSILINVDDDSINV